MATPPSPASQDPAAPAAPPLPATPEPPKNPPLADSINDLVGLTLKLRVSDAWQKLRQVLTQVGQFLAALNIGVIVSAITATIGLATLLYTGGWITLPQRPSPLPLVAFQSASTDDTLVNLAPDYRLITAQFQRPLPPASEGQPPIARRYFNAASNALSTPTTACTATLVIEHANIAPDQRYLFAETPQSGIWILNPIPVGAGHGNGTLDYAVPPLPQGTKLRLLVTHWTSQNGDLTTPPLVKLQPQSNPSP